MEDQILPFRVIYNQNKILKSTNISISLVDLPRAKSEANISASFWDLRFSHRNTQTTLLSQTILCAFVFACTGIESFSDWREECLWKSNDSNFFGLKLKLSEDIHGIFLFFFVHNHFASVLFHLLLCLLLI